MSDHGHDHHHVIEVGGQLGRRLRLSGAILMAVAAVGLLALWPRGDAPDLGIQGFKLVNATVVDVSRETCAGVETTADVGCRAIDADVTSGPNKGALATFTVVDTDPSVPGLKKGDKLVLRFVSTAPSAYRYSFQDFQRSTPLLWLAILFAAVVIGFGRFQGFRALVGLAASGLLLVTFLVPALLRDEPVLLVALCASVAIAGLALYVAHGFSAATTVALFGTLASLVLVLVLAQAAVTLTHLSGLAATEGQVLSMTIEGLDLRGLLVAGIVVGALGSIDDVTVTQVSTVTALRRVDPTLTLRDLYREAMTVGRDHVASSVNTLILAYAGASLPLLLFFAQSQQSTGRTTTSEIVATEIVRMLVGSIGLIAAVPATTALAAALVVTQDVDEDEGDPKPRSEELSPDDEE